MPTTIITGANRGIGLEFCRALLQRGYTVAGLLKRIDQLNLDNSGSFWHSNGDVLPW